MRKYSLESIKGLNFKQLTKCILGKTKHKKPQQDRILEDNLRELIKEWKNKYGCVFELSVEGKKAYLRKPDLKIFSDLFSYSKSDPIEFNRMLLKCCWLGGDEEIQTDDELFLAALVSLSKLIEVKKSALKTL